MAQWKTVVVVVVVLVVCLTERVLSSSELMCDYPSEYKHHPTDCNRFIHCAMGHPYVKRCPLDFAFNDILRICVFRNSLYDNCTPRGSSGASSESGGSSMGGTSHGDTSHGGNSHGGANHGGNSHGDNAHGGSNNGGYSPDGSTLGSSNSGQSTGNTGSDESTGVSSDITDPATTYRITTDRTNMDGSNSAGTNSGSSDSGSHTVDTVVDAGQGSGNTISSSGLSPNQGRVVRVLGDMSASSENARSSATCPSNSIVLNCVCNDRTGCNGQLISGRVCRAFNARRAPGQRALGICFYDSADNWQVVTSLLASSPEATCKPGFRVFACTMYYRNSHREKVSALLDRGRNSCRTASSCRFGRGCRTQAICRKA